MEKYLMLDRRLLSPQAMENIRLEVAHPVKDEAHNPLFTQDKPWEVRIDNGYPNVLYDAAPGLYRCYYTLFIEDEDTRCAERAERLSRNYIPRPDRAPGLAYAQSKDGIHWEKPSLNRVSWHGSRENNLIFPYAHGTGVMIDPHDPDPSRRYKMVTKIDEPGAGAYMAVSFSADGTDWCDPIPWPEHNPPADSHNLPFWNEKERCYMLLSRIWKDGIRITTLSRSEDFLHWSEPKETLRGTGFENQIYAMPVFQWGDLYLGLASMIHEGDRTVSDFDQVDLELTWAADPEKFDFAAAGQHLIPRSPGHYPDGPFDCGCIYASPPVTTPDGEMWIYSLGGNGCHTNWRETSLARARWEPDKFAALVPRDRQKQSTLATCRLQLDGPRLEVLADPLTPPPSQSPPTPCASGSAAGTVAQTPPAPMIQAELSPLWNDPPLPGFSYADSHIVPQENGWLSIHFNGDLKILSGKKVTLKLRTQNTKIWAIQGDILMAGHRLWEGAE